MAPGSSTAVSPRAPMVRIRPASSIASTSHPVAGSQSAACATSASATRSGSSVELTARTSAARTSARESRARRPLCSGRRRLARSARADTDDDARRRVGTRVPDGRRDGRPVPVNRLCVPLECRIPLSPSVQHKYSTRGDAGRPWNYPASCTRSTPVGCLSNPMSIRVSKTGIVRPCSVGVKN